MSQPGRASSEACDGATAPASGKSSPAIVETSTMLGGGARRYRLPEHCDARGALLPLEFEALPFAPRRVFTIRGVPPGTTRGGHAHVHGRQLLVCLSGEVVVDLLFRGEIGQVRLTRPTEALLIEAGVWARQTYSAGATLLVLASEPFDADAYRSTPV